MFISITAPFEDLEIRKLRGSNALIADYSTDYIYTITPQSCDCDEFQRSHNCIHMRFYQHCCIPAKRKKAFIPLKVVFAILAIFFLALALNKDIAYNLKARAIYEKDAKLITEAFCVRAAVNGVNFKDLSLTNYARNDGTYTVNFTPDKEYASRKDFAKNMFSLYWGVCYDVYQENDHINKITFDVYGANDSTEKIMTLSVPRTEFYSYNWSGIQDNNKVFDFGVDGHVKRYPGIGDTPYPKMKDHKFF